MERTTPRSCLMDDLLVVTGGRQMVALAHAKLLMRPFCRTQADNRHNYPLVFHARLISARRGS